MGQCEGGWMGPAKTFLYQTFVQSKLMRNLSLQFALCMLDSVVYISIFFHVSFRPLHPMSPNIEAVEV